VVPPFFDDALNATFVGLAEETLRLTLALLLVLAMTALTDEVVLRADAADKESKTRQRMLRQDFMVDKLPKARRRYRMEEVGTTRG
jgi:hypothetical protein